jgi:hypothetical protein
MLKQRQACSHPFDRNIMKQLINWLRPQSPRRSGHPPTADRQAHLPWWVEVETSVPRCTYYFGPFESYDEAKEHRPGYVQDLHEEGARDIVALVKQCQPDILTIDQGYYSATGQHEESYERAVL